METRNDYQPLKSVLTSNYPGKEYACKHFSRGIKRLHVKAISFCTLLNTIKSTEVIHRSPYTPFLKRI